MNMEKQKAENECQTMEELQKQNLNIHAELAAFKVRFEIEQSAWRERERFLEAKISQYEMQMNSDGGDSMERKAVKVSSAESERSTKSGHVQDEIVNLQKLVKSLKQELRLSKSKEHDFEEERGRFSTCSKKQKMKIQLLERRVTELREKARDNRPQRETTDEPEESLKKDHAFEQKVIVLEKERESLEKTVTLLKEELSQKDKAEQRQRDMFLEMEKQLHQLHKNNADREKAMGNVTGQRALSAQRTAEHWLNWGRKKVSKVQQESLEDEKVQWMNIVNELSREMTSVLVRLESEKEKTAQLEKDAEKATLNTEQMKQAFQDELKRWEQEKLETDRRCKQKLERLRQREDSSLSMISELSKTLEQLETKLKEAREKTVETEHCYEQKLEYLQQREERTLDMISELSKAQEELETKLKVAREKTVETEHHYEQKLEDLQQKEDKALQLKSELVETLEKLEMELKEAREKNVELERHSGKQLEDEKAQWMNRVNELSEEMTGVRAMLAGEKEKTAQLEKKAEMALRIQEQMTRAFQNELKRWGQEKLEMESCCEQKLEHLRQKEGRALDRISELMEDREQLIKKLKEAREESVEMGNRYEQQLEDLGEREDKALDRISELTNTKAQVETELKEALALIQVFRDELRCREQEKLETEHRCQQQLERLGQREYDALYRLSELSRVHEQLETELKEAHEENKELSMKAAQWKQEREKILHNIELFSATIGINKRKKERKGFFSKLLA